MSMIDDDITEYLANASSLLGYIDSYKDTKTANSIASSVIARTRDVKLGLVSSSSVMSFTSTQLLGCIDPSSDTKIASTIASSIIAKSKDVSLPWLINEVDVLTTRSIVKVIDVLAAAKKAKNGPAPPPLDTNDLSSTPSYDDFLDYVFNNKALPMIVANEEELLCNNVKNTNISITPASQVVPTSVDVVTGTSTTTKEYIDQLHLTAIPPPSPSLPTSTTAATTTAAANDNESTLTKKLELVLDTTFLSTDSSGSSDDSYKSHLDDDDDDDDDDVYAEDDNDDGMSLVNDNSTGGGSGTWSYSAKESDDSSSNSNIIDDEDYYDYVDDDEDNTSIGTIDENIVDYAAFRDAIMLNIDKDHMVQDGSLVVVVDNKKQLLSFEELYMSNDLESKGETSGQHCVYNEAAATAADDDDNASTWSFSAVGENSCSAVGVKV